MRCYANHSMVLVAPVVQTLASGAGLPCRRKLHGVDEPRGRGGWYWARLRRRLSVSPQQLYDTLYHYSTWARTGLPCKAAQALRSGALVPRHARIREPTLIRCRLHRDREAQESFFPGRDELACNQFLSLHFFYSFEP